MEDHEQQYDPEKLALLIEKQTKDILKNQKITAAALVYYYQIRFSTIQYNTTVKPQL